MDPRVEELPIPSSPPQKQTVQHTQRRLEGWSIQWNWIILNPASVFRLGSLEFCECFYTYIYIYNMIKLICYRDDIFNICTTYICTYISYIVYILTCTVNPTIKSPGKRPSQRAYPAGYSLADGDRLIVVPDGTDCFTSGLGGSVIQRWCLWRFFVVFCGS